MSNESKDDKALKYFKDQAPHNPGTLFTDPLFPPNMNSLLGLDSNGTPIDEDSYFENEDDVDFIKDEVTFARPKEIFGENYKVFSGKIEFDDVKQGSLGDCYFLSSLGDLCKCGGLISDMFRIKEKNPDGYYEIILIIDGEKRIVIIDDNIPVLKSDKKPCFARPNGHELWVMLLEKAWAKINGGYLNIIGGRVREALECLTGFGSRTFSLIDLDDISKNAIIREVANAENSHCFVTCGSKDDESIEEFGLVPGHAYSIIGLNTITTVYRTKYTLLRLRNPWSCKEWTGDWSDGSVLWDENNRKQALYKKSDDGIFYMGMRDFFKFFDTLEICYVLYDAVTAKYIIEGEENLKNGVVFNVELGNDGFLNISVKRKHWRFNRDIKNKSLPTHISVVRYDLNAKNKLEIFSDYSGTSSSYETCTLNKKVKKGNYLIYVYRDLENAQFIVEPKMEIEIVSSTNNFSHYQMNYDPRDQGFPLLQNIILQAVIKEELIAPNEDVFIERSNESLNNNGIAYYIYYNSTPGDFNDLKFDTSNNKNILMMSPYFGLEKKKFNISCPSGKYIVLLGLVTSDYSYAFNFQPAIDKISYNSNLNYYDNDIDLTYYLDKKNNIKNASPIKGKTHSFTNAIKSINFDVKYSTFDELNKKYKKYLDLLKEIKNEYRENKKLKKQLKKKINSDIKLKWGTIEIAQNNYLYIGQLFNDKKEGKGVIIDSKKIFVGEFYCDLKNGLGITYNKDLKKANEFIYSFDIMKADKGKIYFYNGDKYDGQLKDFKREGKGKYYYKSGEKYEGEWKNNAIDGKGILHLRDKTTYIGEFKNYQRDGKGTLYFNNRDKYVGDFKNDLREGRGIYYYNNGNKYEGDYKNNIKEGKGILYFANGDRYEGDFKNDLREGRGIYYYNNGDRYEGDYKNNLPEGNGIYYYNNGDRYDGGWKNNKKEGKGILYFNNGDIYDGDFKNNLREGRGVLYFKNGDREMGDWKNGKKIGNHAFLSNDGKVELKEYNI